MDMDNDMDDEQITGEIEWATSVLELRALLEIIDDHRTSPDLQASHQKLSDTISDMDEDDLRTLFFTALLLMRGMVTLQ